MAENYDPRATSVAIGGDRKKRGWLWWLLGLLVLLIVLAIVLLSGGDKDSASAPATTTAAAQTTPAPAATTPATDPAATTAGTLIAGSVSLLAGGAASIRDQVGQTATGTGLKVLSVDGSGFFIGTDESDRQFVEFGGRVGQDEPQSYQAKAGDTVSLSGPVRPAPADPQSTLKLSADAAQAVTGRGAYINADTVTPAS